MKVHAWCGIEIYANYIRIDVTSILMTCFQLALLTQCDGHPPLEQGYFIFHCHGIKMFKLLREDNFRNKHCRYC